MKVDFRGKSIEIPVRKLGFFEMGRGLMFRNRKTESLLFDFRREGRWAITSYFVFFDFLAVWIDEKDEVIDWEIVKPFRFRIVPRENVRKLVEVPLNSKNAEIVRFFVEEQRKV